MRNQTTEEHELHELNVTIQNISSMKNTTCTTRTTEQCTSICLISASSSRENSSDVSSGVRGVASQSAACTISKLSSTVGAALAAVNGEGGTLKGKQTQLFSKHLTQMSKTI